LIRSTGPVNADRRPGGVWAVRRELAGGLPIGDDDPLCRGLTLRLWDLRRAAQRGDVARHRDLVTALELFDHHRKLLTASYDGTLRVWRTLDGVQVHEFAANSPNERVTSAALIGRSRVVYAQADGYAHVADLKNGRTLWSKKHRYPMGVVAAAPAIDGFLTGDRYGLGQGMDRAGAKNA
jgi:WD40 repeat protein